MFDRLLASCRSGVALVFTLLALQVSSTGTHVHGADSGNGIERGGGDSFLLVLNSIARETAREIESIQRLADLGYLSLDPNVSGENAIATLDASALRLTAKNATSVAVDCAYLLLPGMKGPADPLAAKMTCEQLARDHRYEEKDAINTPSVGKIEWSRKRLGPLVAKIENTTLENLYPIVLHELLGLMKIEDSDYRISGTLWGILQRTQSDAAYEHALHGHHEMLRSEFSEKLDPGLEERRLAIANIEDTTEFRFCANGGPHRNRSCAAAYLMLERAQARISAQIQAKQEEEGYAEAAFRVWAQSQR